MPSQLVHHSTGDDSRLLSVIVNRQPVRYGVTPWRAASLTDKAEDPARVLRGACARTLSPAGPGNVNTWLQSGTTGACCAPWTARCARCCRTVTAGSTSPSVLPILQQLPTITLQVGRADRDACT